MRANVTLYDHKIFEPKTIVLTVTRLCAHTEQRSDSSFQTQLCLVQMVVAVGLGPT